MQRGKNGNSVQTIPPVLISTVFEVPVSEYMYCMREEPAPVCPLVPPLLVYYRTNSKAQYMCPGC
eukprot:COSAG02_NODE_52608_length_306_cov_18.106280_1_plen_64_part_10